MASLYNHSKEETQEAELIKCPYCRGFGRVSSDEGNCFLCNGYGELWKSITDPAWYRAKWSRESVAW